MPNDNCYLNVIGVGDSVEYLKQVPDDSVDAAVGDPPYGLGDEPDVEAVLRSWLKGEEFAPKGTGFMGKAWDAFVPGPPIWKEVYRILKPGAYCLMFFGTRTYDWGVMAMRIAGFEVLDQIDWIYGAGFPKSLDVAKAIDKRAGVERKERDEPVTEDAKRWSGWGTSKKPAHEPVVLARKPLVGTYAENVLDYGTGAMNIDSARLGKNAGWSYPNGRGGSGWHGRESLSKNLDEPKKATKGRWPANVILAHLDGCELVGMKRVRTGTAVQRNLPDEGGKPGYVTFKPGTQRGPDQGYGDADGKEEVEDWRCAEGCPVAEIDRQSGITTGSGKAVRGGPPRSKTAHLAQISETSRENALMSYGDSGGASRFFYCAKAQTKNRWAYCKACDLVFKRDGNVDAHSDHEDDVVSHPTQKPVKLMEYLIRLVTQPGGVIVDPFCGTGTTSVAAKRNGYNFITCELDPNYAKIAEARVGTVGVEPSSALMNGAVFCPGCKAKGQIKLIAEDHLKRSEATGRKITCAKCFKRYTHEQLRGSGS